MEALKNNVLGFPIRLEAMSKEERLDYLNTSFGYLFPGYTLKLQKDPKEYDEDYEPKDQVKYPIKSREDIVRFQEYMLRRYQSKRNYVLFTVGVNINLRGGDLLNLRVRDFRDADGTWRTERKVREQKQRNSASRGIRKLYYADIVVETVRMWVESQGLENDDYLFFSRKGGGKTPLGVDELNRIMKEAGTELGYPLPLGSHSLRKTWAYKAYTDNIDNPRALELVQEALGHSSVRITRRYLGFEDVEQKSLYVDGQLGEMMLQ